MELMRGARALFSQDSDVWLTPDWVLEKVRALDHTGRIGLDPCTEPDNPTGAEQYFTQADDGLTQDWRVPPGRVVFVNPPYSDCKSWAEKVDREVQARVGMVALLVPARTDTAWWRTAVRHVDLVAFFHGRLRFSSAGPAPFPSALLLYGGWGIGGVDMFRDVATVMMVA